MRADARRSRARLVAAAAALVLETGGEPTRDAVARRAGVGIGTLYRHFPESQDLLRAVALDALDRAIERGEAALTDAPTGGDAIRRYMHDAIDAGLGVVNIVHPLLDDTEWPERRRAARDVLDRLVHRATSDGTIGCDLTSSEVSLATIRFSRPLAIGLDLADERTIAHRQLDCYLDGLVGRRRGAAHAGQGTARLGQEAAGPPDDTP